MIKVNIKKENNNIIEITITGHANYDDYGKDIVCSSVSSIVITTVNGISKLDSKFLDVIEEKNKMIIKILKDDDICQKLISNMIELLNELSSNYPKNIIVK